MCFLYPLSLEHSSRAAFLFSNSEVGMVGDFLRSALNLTVHCGCFAFVSTMVAFYVLFLESVLKPGSCTSKTLNGEAFVLSSPVRV